MSYKRFLKYHLPVIFFCITIFILSSIPGEEIPDIGFEFGIDKIAHFCLYAILCYLFFYSLKNQNKSVKLYHNPVLFALIFSVVYGISDEFHQYFVPGRSPDIFDIAADTAGAAVMCILIIVFLKKRRNG